MFDLIKALECQIKDYDEKERLEYELMVHKRFSKGDWVTNGDEVGIVSWIENLAIEKPENSGYFGFDIKNKNGGFSVKRRNDYEKLKGEQLDYYVNSQTLTITVTGEDVERFFMSGMGRQNVNPSKIKGKLADAFEALRPF